MSHRGGARSRATLAAVLLAMALAPAALLGAQPGTAVGLQAAATRLFGDLARLRGLAVPSAPPRVVVRAREERRRFIAGELARKFAPARIEAERRALVAWGLIPPDFDLGGFLTDLVLEQAAAYYDPVGKVMVLANWLPPEEQREALAHELVHALQDHQIDLDRFLTPPPGRGDEALARQSLIEGEAVALALDRMLGQKGQNLGQLPDVATLKRAIEISATGPLLARAPRFLRMLLTFPYANGLGFVHEFRRRHPWREFSRLYADPPRSSAQILHPERYLDRREDPVPVPLPDLGPALGPGARLVFEDDAGELGLTGVLREFLGEEARVGHWRGDRYAVWEGGGATTVLVALSVWDAESDAAALADAYERLLVRKHGLAAPTDRGPLTRWEASGQAFLVERRGREVLLLERAPTASADGVRRAIWGHRPRSGRADQGRTVTSRQRAPARLSSTIPASITPAPSEISRTR